MCDTGDPVCNYNPGATILPAALTAVHGGYAIQPTGDRAWGQRVYDLLGPPTPKPSQPDNATLPNPQQAQNISAAGAYTGTWGNAVTRFPAVLNLTSIDPIAGTIDVPGVCSAAWTEAQRLSDFTRMVNANVTSGGGTCTDNQRALTISANQINGVDTVHGDTTVSFVHR